MLFVTAATLAACGGGGGDVPTTPAFSGMRIAAGESVSDTVLAKPVQALVVELLENGKPRPGLVVRFEGIPAQAAAPGTPGGAAPGVLVSGVASNDFAGFVSDTTDQNGRASALVQLGMRAGTTGVQVTCPELGLSDTAQYTVLPGNASKVIAGVRDTVVRVGGSFAVGAYIIDRFGNPRSQDNVTYEASDGLGTVDGAGTVRAGQAVGRSTIFARANGIQDSTKFTVVPIAKLTAVYDGQDGLARLATLQLDGSNLKVIGQVFPPIFPAHSPTDDLIVLQRGSFGQGIELRSGSGDARVLVEQPTLAATYYPVFSPDGAFVYFSGASSGTQPPGGIWRIRLDGSGLTRVASTDFGFTTPGVSPDGTRIAFSRQAGLFVQTITTGDSVNIGRPGWFPSFSPDGQRVAFIDGGGITIAKTDGTGAKTIAVGTFSDARVSWIPDGKWLLTRRYDGPVLLNSINNDVVPLKALSRFREMTVGP
jgi:hypothetical protein